MATSTPADAPAPREAILASLAEQTAAIDEIIGLARLRLMVFDVDLSQCGWQTAARADGLTAFLRRDRQARLAIIVHDTRWLEGSCPRLLSLHKLYAHAITICRTGPEARSAMDPLLIADGRHFLHRFHVDQPRAALGIEQPQLARPLVTRFEEIWATGEPGVSATVLGL
jgi:hypothetical protein